MAHVSLCIGLVRVNAKTNRGGPFLALVARSGPPPHWQVLPVAGLPGGPLIAFCAMSRIRAMEVKSHRGREILREE